MTKLYYAFKNNGAFKLHVKKKVKSLLNSKKIRTQIKHKHDHQRIFESRSHYNKSLKNWISNNFNDYSELEYSEIIADTYFFIKDSSFSDFKKNLHKKTSWYNHK